MVLKLKQLIIPVLFCTAVVVSSLGFTQAAQLNNRSITVGSSAPSAVTTHKFDFIIPSVSSLGSIEFEYCSNSPFVGAVCTAPGGFSASTVLLTAQTGETGFTIDPVSTANRIVVSRTAALSSAIPVSYTFSNITNQNMADQTVYVRISTFASMDGTGSRTDDGSVVYSTARGVSVTAFVPPYLTFCVGVVVALNCSSASGSQLSFGEFSTRQTKFLTSQFSVATNDANGYGTSINGTTMTSGNNIIPALNSPQNSSAGVGQFGMNLKANSNPAVGANPAGIGSAIISPNYNVTNQFYFGNEVVVSSPTSTEFNLMTTSYIVNINESQKPGVYSTTLTYIATAAF